MIFYKVLNVDGTPFHGGTSRWHLPTADGPGEWMPAIPDPVPCARGYHLCRDAMDLLEWLGPTIWVAEVDGAVVTDHNKVVVERARLLRRLPWDERIAREFAADCAERVLPVYEAARPGDDRARRAVEVARAYARGEATRDELVVEGIAAEEAAREAAGWAATDAAVAAAWAVARAAAWDAGETAAPAAAWATDAVALAAAEDAAWVAKDTIEAAAQAAAEAAAWAATEDAIEAAAWAAEDAAWVAAETAKTAKAAEAAERHWQATRLAELLGIDPPRPR